MLTSFNELRERLITDEDRFVAPDDHILKVNGIEILYMSVDEEDTDYVNIEFVRGDGDQISVTAKRNFELFEIVKIF